LTSLHLRGVTWHLQRIEERICVLDELREGHTTAQCVIA
jgi:hypothetical protein